VVAALLRRETPAAVCGTIDDYWDALKGNGEPETVWRLPGRLHWGFIREHGARNHLLAAAQLAMDGRQLSANSGDHALMSCDVNTSE